jgi:hypothetical protein
MTLPFFELPHIRPFANDGFLTKHILALFIPAPH